MSHEVPWTNDLTEQFIKDAALSDTEAYIMRSRVRGATVTEQSIYLNRGISTVHAYIAVIKDKYDRVQAEHPEKYPVRIKKSRKEKYMDTH